MSKKLCIDKESTQQKPTLDCHMVDVEFEGFKAADSDIFGIKLLLQQTFKDLSVDLSKLAGLIISQNYVGSVIKQIWDDDDSSDEDKDLSMSDSTNLDNDEQIFGVATIINLTSRRDEECIHELKNELLKKCKPHSAESVYEYFKNVLEDDNDGKHVGLLISERLVNLPTQFSLPALESLKMEIEDANKKKMPYEFYYVLIICKIFKPQKQQSKKNKNKVDSTVEEIIYSNPEEEIYCKESSGPFFEYPVEGDAVSGSWSELDPLYKPWRRVLLLDAFKMPEIFFKIKEVYCNG